MQSCPGCGAVPACYFPEICPAAETYPRTTLGPCEHYYVSRDEGRCLAILRENGTISDVEYYEELAEGVYYMHAAGACGA
jgi:hypothetical protein